MKKFNLFAIAFIAIVSVMSFTSCSDFNAELDEMMPETQKPTTPSDDDNDGDDENDENDNDDDNGWQTILDKNFGLVVDSLGNEHWESVILIQKENGDSVKFIVELPFEYTLGDDEYTTTNNADASAFVELASADTNASEWIEDGKGNYLRKITRTQVVKFSKFTRTLVSSHWEAYRYINGNKVDFVTANETASFKNITRTVSEIEKDEKNYEREANLVTVSLIFHKMSFQTSATTYVDRELENEEVEEPSTPSMPDADLTVGTIVKVTELTSSPEYNANQTQIVKWHTVGLVETTTKYYVYVDGSFVSEWYKAELATSSKYNSAMLDNGNWVPAIVSMDNSGWSYTCQYADNTYKVRTVSMNLAVTSGIKNFTKNNTAEVSPFVKTIIDTKNYNGKKYYTVNAYNVSGGMYLAYTVAEK